MSWIFKTTEKSIALRPIRNKNFNHYAKICKILAEDEIELEVVPMEFEDDIVAPEDMAINSDLKMKIQEAFELLAPREVKVLKMRFGIDTNSEGSYEEVGRQFDVTRERIRQIEIKALRKLRHLAPELICLHDQYAA
jgi:RNA polymerase sigma factor (sigma-70 family)